MKHSDIAIKLVAARECGIVKTNAQFWKDFEDRDKFEEEIIKHTGFEDSYEKITRQIDSYGSEEGIICIYDDDFPVINKKVKNNSEKPYLLFYKGDLTLLNNLNNNIAVIGLINPDESITKRETEVVQRLVENELVIVSGLAVGCDTIAHKVCLDMSGKTIAILPSQISKISPAENRSLAEEIVNKGGLLISEYYKEANSRQESISRYIERDRLQAMFAKAVILVASYRKDEGDSGSRHAMESARKYEVERYVMYNHQTDTNNKQFGLNKDLLDSINIDKPKILQFSSIGYLKELKNPNLFISINSKNDEQLTFI